uniref:Uncharacterized protein n=1 Tax=Anopheles funestus TaxID=62324 RepID=A0A182S3J3_ANOFN
MRKKNNKRIPLFERNVENFTHYEVGQHTSKFHPQRRIRHRLSIVYRLLRFLLAF